MKFALLSLLFSVNLWAKPVVLVGYFDAFGRAPFNNSEKVAKILYEKTKNHPDFTIKLCGLRTVFDKSFYKLEDCMKGLRESPKLVLGLGESNCNLKIESVGRNFDKTKGPDNDGVERNYTVIIPGAPREIGFTYPLDRMYCSLPSSARRGLEVSNNAGSFVCNNLAYQFTHKYEDVSFGFIHVPLHNCKNLNAKNNSAVNNLEAMIAGAVKVNEVRRLPIRRAELQPLRRKALDQCLSEFYSRSKGVDEKKSWPF